MQVVHQVAQKLTSTTLPRKSEVEKFSPERTANCTSGAAGRGASARAMPAAMPSATTARSIFAFMRPPIVAAFAVAVMTLAPPAMARLEDLTSREAVSGLKAALEKGSQAAVAALGRADGFLGNPQVKIPLPESLERAERLLRRVGMGRYADEIVVGMNRAAEAAVPEARSLLLDAVKKMSLQDAKGILGGGDTAATEYFRRTTRDRLHARFLPIFEKSTR